MLRLLKFFSKDTTSTTKQVQGDTPYHVKTAEELLENFTEEMHLLKELSQVPDKHFELMFLTPLKKVVQYVQMIPASENHHHARPGGMLEHLFEIIVYALKLRRGKILPTGVAPEEIDLRKDAWTFAVFVAALLHDIGKVIVDTQFNDGKQIWHPLLSSEPPKNYNYKYKADRKHKFHEHLPLLVLYRFVDMNHIQWLQVKDPQAFECLIYFLAGNYEMASDIGDIIQKADQHSVIKDIGGKVEVAAANTKLSLAENFMRYLKKLLKETEKLQANRPGAAVYTNDKYAFFISKRMMDEVKEAMRAEGHSVPSDNARIMDELQQFNVLAPNGDKAIWSCDVVIGNWKQKFSMLAFPIEKIWPSLPERPSIPEDMNIILPDGTSEPSKTSTPEMDMATLKTTENIEDNKPVETVSSEVSVDTSAMEVVETQKEIETDFTDEIDQLNLDDLMSEVVQGDDKEDLNDFSDFNDDIMDDSYTLPPLVDENESTTDEKPAIDNESPVVVQKVVTEQSKTVPAAPTSGKEFVEKAVGKILEGKKASIDAHNQQVYENAEVLLEFEDPDSQGAKFVRWLVDGIKTGKIPVNENQGRVHLVEEGLFLASPAIFRDFESQVPGGSWSQSQKELSRKKINLKSSKGENIFKYMITHDNYRNNGSVINGIVIPNPETKLGLVITEKNEALIKKSNP